MPLRRHTLHQQCSECRHWHCPHDANAGGADDVVLCILRSRLCDGGRWDFKDGGTRRTTEMRCCLTRSPNSGVWPCGSLPQMRDGRPAQNSGRTWIARYLDPITIYQQVRWPRNSTSSARCPSKLLRPPMCFCSSLCSTCCGALIQGHIHGLHLLLVQLRRCSASPFNDLTGACPLHRNDLMIHCQQHDL